MIDMVKCPVCGSLQVYWRDVATKNTKDGKTKRRRTFVCQNPECGHVWRRYENISKRVI